MFAFCWFCCNLTSHAFASVQFASTFLSRSIVSMKSIRCACCITGALPSQLFMRARHSVVIRFFSSMARAPLLPGVGGGLCCLFPVPGPSEERGPPRGFSSKILAVVHNDRLITFAGWNGKKKLNDMFQYNLDSQTFQTVHDSDENDPRLPCRRIQGSQQYAAQMRKAPRAHWLLSSSVNQNFEECLVVPSALLFSRRRILKPYHQ